MIESKRKLSKNNCSKSAIAMLLMSIWFCGFNIQPAKASGTIYIRADGSIEGTTYIQSSDNATYFFVADINDSIVVEKNNIVFDGAGYTLQGAETGTGIDLSQTANVTIQNLQITAFEHGIVFDRSTNSTVFGTNIVDNDVGISLGSSSNNTISGNNMTANNYVGIVLGPSSNYNSVFGNNMTDNEIGVVVGSLLGPSSFNNISKNVFTNNGMFVSSLLVNGSYRNVVNENLVNGKPLVYLEGVTGYTVSDAGQVILVNSSDVLIKNLDLSNSTIGVELWGSNNNVVSENNITANNGYGIYLVSSSNCNDIFGNNIVNNGDGITLSSSSSNNISTNNITNNEEGILLDSSSSNSISANNLTSNDRGILLSHFSNSNSVSGNNVAANDEFGIMLESSSNNTIYNNNFIDNRNQVLTGSINVWDNGLEGNFWSDYIGADSDHDGIGEAPYAIDANNTDDYPLMGMFYGFNVSWIDPGFNLDLISNSSVSAFDVGVWIEHPDDPNTRIIKFNVTGVTGTDGFCRISIPTALLNSSYKVLLNGTEIPFTMLQHSNSTHSYLYFNYSHSTKEVTIVPESPLFLILPLFMIVTLLAIIVYKRKQNN